MVVNAEGPEKASPLDWKRDHTSNTSLKLQPPTYRTSQGALDRREHPAGARWAKANLWRCQPRPVTAQT